ncbi:tRNA (cytidine32/uridine32-2'-O)-methyltransferase [Solimonas aquatica]|uniref:tRNA (cytidine/uridine-2'-O-)-methyltransferase TrmJ n=1 Tax=Solimonas aquatica TaxID=489703 RepID=A0A1H9H686_9GAMM|nr:RNA methyltransferase [Solimonas aquatica]SEQ57854.1 tRNA (cytidine32/uridine32-2'-O)-methyltransferase [Solimonas aquatica]
MNDVEALSRIRIVLVNTQHPGNIGSTARAMLTMGLSELVLVSPQRFPHPQARMTAAHAIEVVEKARVVDSLSEALAGCAWVLASSARPRHLGDAPLTPWDAATRAVQTAASAPVALVFGCERTGLTNEELDLCHAVTQVPTNPGYSSLNLSQAVQVLSYELRKAALPEFRPVAAKQDHPWYAPPGVEDMERFYGHLERILMSTGFLDPANPRLLMRRLRQFFNRASPDRNELNILRGVLKSIEQPKGRRVPLPGDGGEA